jgi:hypothetical protein
MNSTLDLTKDIITRSVALFFMYALPSIGVGSFAGVEPLKAAAIAGGLAISRILTDLAKAYLDDGKLTQEEVDAVFKRASKQKEAEGGK